MPWSLAFVPRPQTAEGASSSTSSRTSRISSTSDPPTGSGRPGIAPFLYGLLRLGHPFPSTLDAVLTGVVATVAGGPRDVVVRLALAMLAIQFAIGATNDRADATGDRIGKPSKPIVAGVVTTRAATLFARGALAVGLVLAGSVSPTALGLAIAGATAGLAYDLRLKGTAASWVPFAVGIPLLPLFAWIGAAGTAPIPILVLSLIAIPAGAAIALANALPDLERDVVAGLRTPATTLGRVRSWQTVAVLQSLVGAAALTSYAVIVCSPMDHGTWAAGVLKGTTIGAVGVAISCVALGGGVLLSSRSRVTARQRGWELQAIASGGLAASWLGGLAAAGRF